MKKLLAMCFLSFTLTGCGMFGAKTEEKTTDNKTTEEKKDVPKIAVGDMVVAKWASGSFYEGKVESIDGTKAKIKWNDGSTPGDVDTVDIYAMPKAGAKPDVKAGDMVLAKVGSGTYWNGAEISGINGDVYVVKPVAGGDTANLPAEKIIKVSAAVGADMKKQAGSTDFSTVAQSKKPVRDSAYMPKVGEKVLGEWSTNSWWSGRVQKTGGGKATIAWEDGSKPSEIMLEKVLPMPGAKQPTLPTSGQYLLVKPASGSKWQYAQTVSVQGANIEVKFATGPNQTVKAGDYVLLN